MTNESMEEVQDTSTEQTGIMAETTPNGDQFRDLLGLQDHPELIRLKGDCPTITIEDGPISEHLEELDGSKEWVAMPYLPYDLTDEVYAALPKPVDEDTPERTVWYRLLTSSIPQSLGGAAFQERLEEEGSDFTNKPSVNGQTLQGELARFGPSKDGNLTGDNVTFRLQQAIGTGAVVQIPLWHSGFWLTLRAPSEARMLELHQRLMQEKIRIGRATYGAAYSNQTVFFTALVMDFIMEHVVRTSIKGVENFRPLIKTTDIHLMAWGLGLSIWPRGFQYVRSIVGDPTDPNKTVTQKIDLRRMLLVDRSCLTEQQKIHMSNRKSNSMTEEQVKSYQDQHVRGRATRVVLQEGSEGGPEEIAMVLEVPSMDDYLDSGETWITMLVAGFDKAAGITNDDTEKRNAYLTSHARATLLRQYGHWVKEIHVGPDKILARADIENALNDLSASSEITEAYFEKIMEYIRSSAIAIVCVPTYHEGDETLKTHPYCYPIDPVSTFFTLLVRKLEHISTR